MKNFRLSERLIKIIVSLIIVLCSVVAFEKLLSNIDVIAGWVVSLFGFIKNMLTPFIFGFSVAYLLNPAVRFFETKVFIKRSLIKRRAVRLSFIAPPGPKKSRGRLAAASVTYLLLVGCIVWVFAYLIPEIINSTRSLITSAISVQSNFDASDSDNILNVFLNTVNETLSVSLSYQDIIDPLFAPVMNSLSSLPELLGRVLAGTVSAAYQALSFLIGLMVSFYMMLEKESFRRAAHKLVYAALRRPAADAVVNAAKSAHHMFERFFIGKILESVIVGIIFFIACLFIRPPYAVLLTLIVGVTNMIPYFGPWIGGAIVVLIVIIRNPMQALWIGLFILILQQVDAAVIAPKILGDSTGLKPLDVIFAIFAGGALFGVPGMFLGVPFYAVIKNIIADAVNRRYDMKNPDPGENDTPE